MPMFIKLEKGKVAKCEISEMPGEEKFDLEIKMLFDQITMNKMVKIKECGSSKENSVLYIDSIFCNKDDLAKIEEHRRYNLKITARELVEETNIRFVYITLNNVDFHNLRKNISYNGIQVECNNVEIHVYSPYSSCTIEN